MSTLVVSAPGALLDDPIDRGACSLGLRFVQVELDGDLSSNPARTEVLKEAGAPDRQH